MTQTYQRSPGVTCYGCATANYVMLHACSIPASNYRPASVHQLADSWRAREDAKALAKRGEAVEYVVRVGPIDKTYETMASAARAALRFNAAGPGSAQLFLVRWWPRTDEGLAAAKLALHWVDEKAYGLGYKRQDWAALMRGPKNAVWQEIPL